MLGQAVKPGTGIPVRVTKVEIYFSSRKVAISESGGAKSFERMEIPCFKVVARRVSGHVGQVPYAVGFPLFDVEVFCPPPPGFDHLPDSTILNLGTGFLKACGLEPPQISSTQEELLELARQTIGKIVVGTAGEVRSAPTGEPLQNLTGEFFPFGATS